MNKPVLEIKGKPTKWLDARLLLKIASSKEEKKEQDLLLVLSAAFDIPPSGITMLSNKPYINSIGLEYKWWQHPDAVKVTNTERLYLYEKIGDTAIVEVIGEDNLGNTRTAIGTAGAANMNMIKGYPNELAETRALNRLLRRVLSPFFYRDFLENIGKMSKEEVQQVQQLAPNVVSVSAEEMPSDSVGDQPLLLTNEEILPLKQLLESISHASTEQDFATIGKEIMTKKVAGELNDKQIGFLRVTFTKTKTGKGLL